MLSAGDVRSVVHDPAGSEGSRHECHADHRCRGDRWRNRRGGGRDVFGADGSRVNPDHHLATTRGEGQSYVYGSGFNADVGRRKCGGSCFHGNSDSVDRDRWCVEDSSCVRRDVQCHRNAVGDRDPDPGHSDVCPGISTCGRRDGDARAFADTITRADRGSDVGGAHRDADSADRDQGATHRDAGQ